VEEKESAVVFVILVVVVEGITTKELEKDIKPSKQIINDINNSRALILLVAIVIVIVIFIERVLFPRLRVSSVL
jgi:hypothetical protein